jgi:hypothetical protein
MQRSTSLLDFHMSETRVKIAERVRWGVCACRFKDQVSDRLWVGSDEVSSSQPTKKLVTGDNSANGAEDRQYLPPRYLGK